MTEELWLALGAISGIILGSASIIYAVMSRRTDRDILDTQRASVEELKTLTKVLSDFGTAFRDDLRELEKRTASLERKSKAQDKKGRVSSETGEKRLALEQQKLEHRKSEQEFRQLQALAKAFKWLQTR